MEPVSSRGLQKSSWKDLIGEWRMTSPQFPGGQGRVRFEWAEDGAFLVLRSQAPDPAPDSVWIIGGDEASEDCTALYSDERGVARVYGMRMKDGIWSIWRAGPFWQRFEARLDEQMRTLSGSWESSEDGDTWNSDFDLVYSRL